MKDIKIEAATCHKCGSNNVVQIGPMLCAKCKVQYDIDFKQNIEDHYAKVICPICNGKGNNKIPNNECVNCFTHKTLKGITGLSDEELKSLKAESCKENYDDLIKSESSNNSNNFQNFMDKLNQNKDVEQIQNDLFDKSLKKRFEKDDALDALDLLKPLYHLDMPGINLPDLFTFRTHELKTWKEYFKLMLLGFKNFEVRKNDRNFQVNEILILKEYDNETKTYTGQELMFQIIYVLHGGQFGIESGYCVMGLKKITKL